MIRKLFIGSSSEHEKICKKIKEAIDAVCSDWLQVEVWRDNGIFELNEGTLGVLARAAREYDYGVFVAADDDISYSRGKRKEVTRDNVIFEAGLFMGGLGLNRTFVVASTKITLPSDFQGATVVKYSGMTPGKKALETLVSALVKTKAHYRLDHMFSTSLAYGYYQGFVKSIMSVLSDEGNHALSVLVPKNVSDLRVRIRQYRRDTVSSEEKKDDMLVVHCCRTPDKVTYWDIPRCLSTLEGLVGYSKHKAEIGGDTGWNQWMERELENFCDVLRALLDEERLYDKKVVIERL